MHSSNSPRAARIIARSFYQELRKAGMDSREIVHVATEILDCLNKTFRESRTTD